jgi:hypothetical protein
VAETLKNETGAVAIMLTGPHALGIDRAEDKLYLLAITDDPDGVIEHRFADRYAAIDRQMEIGIFPRRFIDKLTSEGYWDMVSLRAAEVLRISIPLIDPTGYGERAAAAMSRHLPEKRFISAKIHGIKATFDDAVSLYSKGDYAGAVLVVREALRLAVELAIKQAPRVDRAMDQTPSRARGADPRMDEALRASLGEEGYACLLEGLGISEMDENQVKQHLESLIDLSKRILKDLGIADDFLNEQTATE